MKKEKQVKSYQRRTKSGKMITVRAHTAKYDAAEKAKEAAKKKGAGNEITKVKDIKDIETYLREYPLDKMQEVIGDMLDDVRAGKASYSELAKMIYADRKDASYLRKTHNKYAEQYGLSKIKEPSEKESVRKPDEKKTTGSIDKKVRKAADAAASKSSSSEPAFTVAEFKEWYRGTGSAADKKVAKALRAQLGRAGYRKFEDEAIDNYSSRGHLSLFKRVSTYEFPEQKDSSRGTVTSASLRARADAMDAEAKKSSIIKKVGEGFRTIRNAQLNSPGKNTRTATLRGDLYIGKDGSAYYADPTNKGKLKKATNKILQLNKISSGGREKDKENDGRRS